MGQILCTLADDQCFCLHPIDFRAGQKYNCSLQGIAQCTSWLNQVQKLERHESVTSLHMITWTNQLALCVEAHQKHGELMRNGIQRLARVDCLAPGIVAGFVAMALLLVLQHIPTDAHGSVFTFLTSADRNLHLQGNDPTKYVLNSLIA